MALQYTVATPIAITAANLASGASRSSAAVTTSTANNTTQILLDVAVLTTAVAPTGNRQVNVYAYRSVDGLTYEGASGVVDNVDGNDKALTAIGNPSNLIFVGTLQLNQGASAQTIRKTFDLSGAMGTLPPKWGIVLQNDAGTALGATVTAQYREIFYN